MLKKFKPGVFILITRHRHPKTELPDNLEGLCARVVVAHEDGSVSVDMLYHNVHLGVAPHVELYPDEYEPVTLKRYGVTVCRTGYVPDILAASEEQAKKVVDMFVTDDDVSWSDDWPASDAELEE